MWKNSSYIPVKARAKAFTDLDTTVSISTRARTTELEAFASLSESAPPPGKKLCSGCGEWVDYADFSADTRNCDGLQSCCKLCEAARKRRAYALAQAARGREAEEI